MSAHDRQRIGRIVTLVRYTPKALLQAAAQSGGSCFNNFKTTKIVRFVDDRHALEADKQQSGRDCE